ncbi:MAG: hypothetical protein J5J00_16815 [Deltaproteobacteria bacterium]|nr:hypothetical protein [Deltaproteobacteria bacterium]
MTAIFDPNYITLLNRFSLETLDNADGPVFGIWSDYRLAYYNSAWTRFALENGAGADFTEVWGLGRSIMDAVPEVLRPFYIKFFHTAREKAAELRPVSHVYDCSAPDKYRQFNMTVYPVDSRGWVIVNSLFVEASHGAPDYNEIALAQYIEESGLVSQCAHCRRVKDAQCPNKWDWVAEWVKRPHPNTSHCLCPVCMDYFYPSHPKF